jgi:hypothetical protein
MERTPLHTDIDPPCSAAGSVRRGSRALDDARARGERGVPICPFVYASSAAIRTTRTRVVADPARRR